MVKYYECHLKGLKLKLCQQTDSQIPDGYFQGHQHCPNSFWHYANTRTIHLPRKLTISRFIDLRILVQIPTIVAPTVITPTVTCNSKAHWKTPYISGSRIIR